MVKRIAISQFLATKCIQLMRIPVIFAIETSKEGWYRCYERWFWVTH